MKINKHPLKDRESPKGMVQFSQEECPFELVPASFIASARTWAGRARVRALWWGEKLREKPKGNFDQSV